MKPLDEAMENRLIAMLAEYTRANCDADHDRAAGVLLAAAALLLAQIDADPGPWASHLTDTIETAKAGIEIHNSGGKVQ